MAMSRVHDMLAAQCAEGMRNMKHTPKFGIAVAVIAFTMAAVPALATTKQVSKKHPISAGAIAKAKLTLRILDDASDAELADAKFDPFTAGLLKGTEKNLKEDWENEYGDVQQGDRDLAWMLSVDESFLVEYRTSGYPAALQKKTIKMYVDCEYEIKAAIRQGYTTSPNACEFTDEHKKDTEEFGEALDQSLKDSVNAADAARCKTIRESESWATNDWFAKHCDWRSGTLKK